jgi:heme/copper-type cytochrome/quinol oxidase subunit 2
MYKVLLALHILAAVFAIGPLVHAATTASRGLRLGDAAAIKTSARMCTIYSAASVVVVILGFGLMSATSPYTHEKVADFGDVWIWLSLLLWLVAAALAFLVVVPALDKAAADTSTAPSLVGRVAATGGIVGILFAVIVFLMVYQPGS